MSVSSYLELYLAIFGWYMFDEIWLVLREIGIAFLPFIGMFIRNIAEPIKSQEAKDAAGTSLRRIEIDIAAMMTVIILAAQPILTLNFAGLNYVTSCGSGGTTVTAGSTGTTYDTTFTAASLGGGSAKVPIWWYGVLGITGGINNAVIIKIPCTADIRLVKYELKNSRVKKPRLRREVQNFFNDCYGPAMSNYLDKKNVPDTTDPDDLYWIGSKHLVDNLYPQFRSKTQIEGFAYDPNRDYEYDERVAPLPVNGEPDCDQWWTGNGGSAGSGLKERLKEEIELPILDRLTALVSSAEKAENIALRTLIGNEEQSFKKLERINPYNTDGIINDTAAITAAIGGVLESVSFFPKMYLLKMAAPVVQAMILMMTYLLLPFILVFSSYKLGTMIFMSIVIFSIKFWTVLWAIAHWLDDNLIIALRPNGGLDLGYFILNNGLTDVVLGEMVINFTTATMYIVFPLFWTSALTWAGFRTGNAITDASDKLSRPSGSAGDKGGNKITK